jgi:4-diphosphocytidyl-2-C-methyl-D-erythritol kinase
VRTVAPAKINWTLEVLGRRDDGYHEIRSVMQTIDLCDEVSGKKSSSSIFETTQGEPLSDNDLMVRAARALEERLGRPLPAYIRVEKRIPVASGLGGGSSDAAAVLRLLDRLYSLRLLREEVAEVAACLGSDVPFFVYGGTAVVEDWGERVTPLADVPGTWFVILTPPVSVPEKTKRMYEALEESDFSDGSRGQVLSQRLRRGKAVREEDLYNVFERVAYTMFERLETYRDALLSAGAKAAHLAGAGPALFDLTNSAAAAKGLAERLQAQGAKVVVTRTMIAREATAVTD